LLYGILLTSLFCIHCHKISHFLSCDRSQGDAHAAHADGAKDVIIDGTDDGHFLGAQSHDAAPPVIYRIVPAGKDHFAEETLQFLLNGIGDGHLRCRLGCEGEVAGAAQ